MRFYCTVALILIFKASLVYADSVTSCDTCSSHGATFSKLRQDIGDIEKCERWFRICKQFTYSLAEDDKSSCTVDPTQRKISVKSTECLNGITDAISGSVLGPYYVGVAVADFVGSVNSSCKGYAKVFAEEVAKVNKVSSDSENAYMLRYFGARPKGTWENISCDQLSQINLCQGYDPTQNTETCKAAFDLKKKAEETFSQSVFSRIEKSNSSQYQLVVPPQELSSGILKARLKQCESFQKSQKDLSDINRKYLKDLRASIAKEGSCGEAFDSTIAAINNFSTPESTKYRKANSVAPQGCFSDEYLSEKYCKIAADVAMFVGPTAAGAASKLVKSAAKVAEVKSVSAANRGVEIANAPATAETLGVLKSPKYSKKNLAVVEDLRDRRVITQTDINDLIATNNSDKVWKLHMEDKISESEIGKILDVFNSIKLGEPIGPEKLVEFTPRGKPSEVKSKIIVQEREGDDGDKAMALIDPVTKKAIGRLDYSINGSTLRVDYINIKTVNQNFGYPEVLLEETLKAHPEVKSFTAELFGTNLAALEKALKSYPLEEAIQKTPAYKSAIRLGYEVKVRAVKEVRSDGSSILNYVIEGAKPGSVGQHVPAVARLSVGQLPSQPLDIAPYMGRDVVDIQSVPFSVPQGAKVSSLNEKGGWFGGKVYRVELSAPQENIEIYKTYEESSDAVTDYKRLRVLYSLSQEPGYQGLKVVKPLRQKGKLLVTENQYGETVQNILDSDAVSADDKLRVSIRYHQQLRALYKSLKKKYPGFVMGDSMQPGLLVNPHPGKGQIKKFFVKPDNVLVDPKTLELTIIDPY